MDPTDTEIVRLCAKASGWKTKFVEPNGIYVLREKNPKSDWNHYDPLHDDAQCFALVKKHRILVKPMPDGKWFALAFWEYTETLSEDLNRAICECVSKMQKAKE